MLKIISGDTDKIGLLYEKYSNLLFGYFFKLTRNRELSEDLVNDVFLKILYSKDSYRGDGIFTVWMFRIAHSIFVDNYNKSKRLNTKEIFSNTTGTIVDPEISHEKEENRKLIHRALLKLKKKEREVIVLSKLNELKYKEVAEILHCTEEAAKTRTFRALKNLKIVLQKIQN
ncbi:sigma-70 family RNA polymerase sigma factor [Maribellus comscasis]|uniref:Sigma-70 family RNA polymerase sigma factor n=1 Tax=Maribellus comscasis TaxID=2681766 RepID=A0A6I6JX77_9BACT|nr:RNA polymerase sigma factor [Maribellus comscasis]QGY43733.1 sigma-70 family RNA polymerase sigma factor [Maribellus comscasis]